MKRSFKLLLVALLILSMLQGFSLVYADRQFDGDDDDTTTVYWDLSGCWIDISAHNSLDMGDYNNTVPGDAINSESEPAGSKKVQVTTNCKSNYTVNVEATDFTLPVGHPDTKAAAIQDFAVKANQGDVTSYQAFSGLNSLITLITAGGPSTTNLTMDYQYTIDANDIPGTYTVYLTYTASTV